MMTSEAVTNRPSSTWFHCACSHHSAEVRWKVLDIGPSGLHLWLNRRVFENLQMDRAKNDKYKIYQKQKQIIILQNPAESKTNKQIISYYSVNDNLKTSPCRVGYPGSPGSANSIDRVPLVICLQNLGLWTPRKKLFLQSPMWQEDLVISGDIWFVLGL